MEEIQAVEGIQADSGCRSRSMTEEGQRRMELSWNDVPRIGIQKELREYPPQMIHLIPRFPTWQMERQGPSFFL